MSELEPTRTYSNPTATEGLRRLLDERGVVWGASDTYRLLVTSWNDVSGHSWAFMEHRDGSFSKLTAYHLTPEQAIAATLGSCNCPNSERTETCHEIEDEDTGFIVCSECGAVHDESYTAYYCWCCGRRIEQ